MATDGPVPNDLVPNDLVAKGVPIFMVWVGVAAGFSLGMIVAAFMEFLDASRTKGSNSGHVERALSEQVPCPECLKTKADAEVQSAYDAALNGTDAAPGPAVVDDVTA